MVSVFSQTESRHVTSPGETHAHKARRRAFTSRHPVTVMLIKAGLQLQGRPLNTVIKITRPTTPALMFSANIYKKIKIKNI